MTMRELKDQTKDKKAKRTKPKKTKTFKKQTESNSKPKSRKGSKEDQAKPKKLASAKLRNIGGKGSGVVGSGKIEETLKSLGLTVADLKKLG